MDNFTLMDSWPEWVRWLLILPVAALCFALGYVSIIVWATALWNSGTVLLIWGVVFSAVLIWCTCCTAPSFKFVVAVLLAIVLFLTLAVSKFPLFGMISVSVGLILAGGLIVWGYLRRQAGSASR